MRTGVTASVLILFAASVATLALKAAATNYRAGEDMPRLERDIATVLRAQGFEVTRQGQIGRPATFYGQRDDCRVLLRAATVPGSFDGNYRKLAAPIGPLSYRIFDDEYAEPPMMRLWWLNTIQTTRMRLGIATARRPALALAGSSECAERPLDTSTLRVFPLARGGSR